MIADDLLIGLRMSGMVLFSWLGWRVMFESWDVTSASEAVRVRAWYHFRASILVMCFTMVFLASPANILRAHGLISQEFGFWMMVAVTFFAIVYAALVHHALDLVNHKRGGTIFACVLITFVSALWGLRGAL